jgi:hypothetical protein
MKTIARLAAVGALLLMACHPPISSSEARVYSAVLAAVSYPAGTRLEVGSLTVAPAAGARSRALNNLVRGGVARTTADSLLAQLYGDRVECALPSALPSAPTYSLVEPRPVVDRVAEGWVDREAANVYSGGFATFTFSRVAFAEAGTLALVFNGDTRGGGFFLLRQTNDNWQFLGEY